MEEIWKAVKGYEGFYEVSSYGRVRSLDRWIERPHPRNPAYTLRYIQKGKILNQRHHQAGYWLVDLSKGDIAETKTVHRMVAEAFIPNPDNLPEVNHIDENKENSRADNLEWTDRIQNLHHATGLERMGKAHWTPCIQMTMDGQFVKRWECMQEAADELGLHMTHISACCRGRAKTHGGFIWKYPEE